MIYGPEFRKNIQSTIFLDKLGPVRPEGQKIYIGIIAKYCCGRYAGSGPEVSRACSPLFRGSFHLTVIQFSLSVLVIFLTVSIQIASDIHGRTGFNLTKGGGRIGLVFNPPFTWKLFVYHKFNVCRIAFDPTPPHPFRQLRPRPVSESVLVDPPQTFEK